MPKLGDRILLDPSNHDDVACEVVGHGVQVAVSREGGAAGGPRPVSRRAA